MSFVCWHTTEIQISWVELKTTISKQLSHARHCSFWTNRMKIYFLLLSFFRSCHLHYLAFSFHPHHGLSLVSPPYKAFETVGGATCVGAKRPMTHQPVWVTTLDRHRRKENLTEVSQWQEHYENIRSLLSYLLVQWTTQKMTQTQPFLSNVTAYMSHHGGSRQKENHDRGTNMKFATMVICCGDGKKDLIQSFPSARNALCVPLLKQSTLLLQKKLNILRRWWVIPK